MALGYEIRSIKDIIDDALPISNIGTAIADAHGPFFPDWSRTFRRDRREPVTYQFGPTITEEGIVERWSGYEAQYRSEKRIMRFWAASMQEAVVEPTSLTVLGDGYVVRETVRSAVTLRKVFGDVDLDDCARVLRGQGELLNSEKDLAPGRTVDEAFVLGFGMYENYFNWTIRYASRIRLLDAFPVSTKILVPKTDISYIQSTLSFMKIPHDRIVSVNSPIRVKNLYLCSPFALGRYQLSPQMIVTLQRNPIIKQVGDTRIRKLYIPRADVKMRRVVNEPAVINMLAGLGFKVFDNAKHSVEEQARAFRSARMIVAPHGAGLSNIVYAKPGTTIVEVIPEGYDQGVTSYRSLADLFGHRYIPLFAREAAPDRKGNRCNSDIEVDIAELKQVCENL